MANFLFVYPSPVEFAGDGTFASFRADPGQKIESGDYPDVDFTADPFSRYFDPVNGPPVTPPDDTQPQQ